MDFYILNGKMPVKVDDFLVFTEHSVDDKQVAFSKLADGTEVSTVFMGVDLSWGRGKPQLFETMTFSDGPSIIARYATWEEAEHGHKEICDRLNKEARKSSDLDSSPCF